MPKLCTHQLWICYRLFCYGFTAAVITFAIIISSALAQGDPFVTTQNQLTEFMPPNQSPVLRGMRLHPENSLLFDFIIDRGHDSIHDNLLKSEANQLIKYFLTAITVPDQDSWVNLSPYESQRIIPDALGQTEMGRQMLQQDFLLKQLAASMTNPNDELGKKYWDAIQDLNLTNSQNLAAKIWIVPDRATVVEKDGLVYITESKLKVLMQEDYEVLTKSQSPCLKAMDAASDVFRKIILPQLQREVNEARSFAPTRQVYQSVILAAWYKRTLRESLLGRIYTDQSKIVGVQAVEKNIKEKVYQQYLAAFKQGAYSIITEDTSAQGEIIPHKYFSGGLAIALSDQLIINHSSSALNLALADIQNNSSRYALVRTNVVENESEAQIISRLSQETISSSSILLIELPLKQIVTESLNNQKPIYFRSGSMDYEVAQVSLGEFTIRAGHLVFIDKTLKFMEVLASMRIALEEVIVVGRQSDTRDKTSKIKKYIIPNGIDRFISRQQVQVKIIKRDGDANYPFMVQLTNLSNINVPHLYRRESLEQLKSFIDETADRSLKTAQPISVVVDAFTIESNQKLIAKLIKDPILFDHLSTTQLTPETRTTARVVSLGFDPVSESLLSLSHPQYSEYPQIQVLIKPNGLLELQVDLGHFWPINIIRALENYNDEIQATFKADSTPSLDRINPDSTRQIKFAPNQFMIEFRLGRVEDWRPGVIFRAIRDLRTGSLSVFASYIPNDPDTIEYVLPLNQAVEVSLDASLSREVEPIVQMRAIDGALEILNETDLTLQIDPVIQASSPTQFVGSGTKGGIDFDSSRLNLQIKRDQSGAPLSWVQQDIKNIHLEGLTPVIVTIKPLNSQTLSILTEIQLP